ncbi:MAG: very short patch repair endonuclease [Bacteroidales bacterium]|nr:very short patch repair endonuclease [Bacteroidales bacterium]MDD4669458.1 very short patch repair endonuclease [Bacteroidales bacterium]
MSDILTLEQRHQCMSHIRGKNTKPEMIVRHALHSAGFRYRLNVHTLPGTPDIVLRRYRTVIFVNGCFWHGHRGCRFATTPKSNIDFWKTKIRNNQLRDEATVQYLEVLGWKVVTIWECQLKKSNLHSTMTDMIVKIRQNEVDYAAEQSKRRKNNAEFRAILKERRIRYEETRKELINTGLCVL